MISDVRGWGDEWDRDAWCEIHNQLQVHKKQGLETLFSWIVGPHLHQSPVYIQVVVTDQHPILTCQVRGKKDSFLEFHLNQEQRAGSLENTKGPTFFHFCVYHMDLTFVNLIGE